MNRLLALFLKKERNKRRQKQTKDRKAKKNERENKPWGLKNKWDPHLQGSCLLACCQQAKQTAGRLWP
jgi:hypothetical protein